MNQTPKYGQVAGPQRRATCPRHPKSAAISQCKRCGRPTCPDCTIRTEVADVCPDCLSQRTGFRQFDPQPVGYASARRQHPRLLRGTTMSGAIIIITSVISISTLFTNWPLNLFAYAPALGLTQPWRMLTVALVHGGIMHLAMNMFSLYLFGPPVERVMGWWRFLGIYLISTLGGSLAVLAYTLISPSSLGWWNVGASGAIFGLFGALFVVQRFLEIDTRALLILLIINLGYGFYASNVSWQAHVGGLLFGTLSAWTLIHVARPRPSLSERTQATLSALVIIAILIVQAAAATGIYYALGALN